MSTLQPFTDPTGVMPLDEINSKNISNIIQELNNIQATTGNIINQPTYTEINDGTNNRVLIGFNNTTQTWGIFATPPGTDISNATTPSQFSFSSDYSSLTVAKSGAATIPSPGSQTSFANGTASTTVTHNLGFVPAFIYFPIAPGAVYQNGVLIGTGLYLAGNNSWSDNTGIGAQAQNFYDVGAAINTTTLYLYNGWATGDGTATPSAVTVQYYLLQQTA